MKGKRWLAGAVAAAMLMSVAPAYAFADRLDEPAAADESALECTKAADCPAQEHEPDCPAAQVPQPEPNAALTRENTEPDTTTPETETTPEPEESGDVKQPDEETPEEEPEESKAVCSINGKEYGTLDEAVEEAEEGATIVITADCETDGMNLSKNLTLKGAEELEEKPVIRFTDKGIALWGKKLTFDNVEIVMDGIGSTPYTAEWSWMAICASKDAILNLNNSTMTMDGTGTTNSPHAIYFCQNNKLNLTNSTLEIKNYANDALEWDGGDGGYNINLTNSTFISDHNRSGFTGTFWVKATDSDIQVINSTGNGANGSHFDFTNCEVNFSDNGSHGLSAGALIIDHSTVTTNNNTGMGIAVGDNLQIKNGSVVTVEGNASNTGYGYAAVRLYNNFDFLVDKTSKLSIKNNNNTGLYVRQGNLTVEDGADLEIMNNTVTHTLLDGYGGGLYVGYGDNYDPTVTLPADAKIYNNHALIGGDDIYISQGITGPSATFGPVGSDWVLDDCNDPIDGWYDDSEGTRWKAHDEDPNADLHMVVESGFVAGETRKLTGLHSLKAAHGLLHTVTTSIDNSGSINGDGQYLHGTDVQVTFNPADGYKITSVTVNDTAYDYHWDSTLNAYVVELPDLSADMHVVVTTKRDSDSGGGGHHNPPKDDDDDDEPADEPEEDIPEEEVPLAETPWLNTVDHYAYIVGYPEDYVTGQPTEDESRWPIKPQANITRAEVATIFFRLLTDEARDQFWMTTNDFPDVAADAWYNNAISTMVNAGIIQGYEDGTFRPNDNITRAEFAAIASRFMSSGYDVEEDLFTDISGHWARENINDAAMTKWINGYPDGTFLPDNDITRAEAVTLVNNVLRRAPDADHMLDSMIKWPDNMDTSAWYYEAMQEATNSHDYDMFEGAEYETWTALEENRDWAALEQDWMNAHRGGGEVM